MRQKVFPLPTVRAPSASNSPSALSAQALWYKVKKNSQNTDRKGGGDKRLQSAWP